VVRGTGSPGKGEDMAVGRISGPLLKRNLIRDGVELTVRNTASDADILYIDVVNGRIGVNSSTPGYDLDVNGTTNTTSLRSGLANIDNVEINDAYVRSTVGDLTIEAATAFDKVIIQQQAQISNIVGDVELDGSLHATGNITADGSITLGDANTDNVAFNADINSDFNPDVTDAFSIGTPSQRWRTGHFHNINVGEVEIVDNVIQPVNTNDDLIIRANGSGSVDIYGLVVDQGGNVSLTGDTLVFGNLLLDGDGDRTGVIARDSNTDLYLDASGTGRIYTNGVDLLLDSGNTYYVTANGNDANSGTGTNDAFATLQQAVSVAVAGDTINVGSGTFEEVTPIDVPAGVTINGQGLRATQIKPSAATRTNDVFKLNGETTITGLTVREVEWDNINGTGYAFRYQSGALITRRSAYIKDVTVLNLGSSVRLGTNDADDPYGYDAGDAGRGALMDGSILAAGSIEPAMLFDSCTFIVPNNQGLVITEGGRVEWLNSFVYFASVGVEGVAGTTGWYGDGKTKVELAGITGTIAAGDTGTFTSTDGSTVVTVTVESVEGGNTIVLDGRVDDFEGFDFTPASIAFAPSGATATSIIRYDRKQFGAEMRSIASANVYGDVGVQADGPGVRLRLSSHDFGYIGAGKKFDNNDYDVITANQVIEANGGKVYYQASDQYGDYRIGDLFTVDQDTGNVTFSSSGFNVQSLTGITFTDGPNTSIVDPTQIQTGNLRLAGNDLLSLSGDININPFGSNSINLENNTNITGNLDVTGNVTIGGNIQIGDQDTDAITVSADFDSDLVPNADVSYDLGDPAKRWNALYVREVNVEDVNITDNLTVNGEIFGGPLNTDDIRIASNRIETTASNANLEIDTAGTGTIELQSDTNVTGNFDVSVQATLASANIEDLTATRVVFAGTDGELEDSADFTFDGTTLQLTNDINVDRQAILASANIEDLTATRVVFAGTDGELEDDANFTYDKTTDTLVVDGTLDVNTDATIATLKVEDLTNGRVVLAGTGGEIEDSANLTFDGTLLTVTGNQYITGNLDVDGNITLGGNIRIGDQDVDTVEVQADFTSDLIPNASNQFDLGSISKGWRTLHVGQIEVDSIEINDNYIRTQESNANLELRPNGTGTVVIDSDQALQIPVGNNAVRPTGVEGQIRFNTQTNLFEGYNGTAWNSLGGVRDTDQDTYIIAETTVGNDDDTLSFYTANQLSATLNSTQFDTIRIVVDDLVIDNNRISVQTANTNFEIASNGTGTIELESDTNVTGNFDVSLQATFASANVEDLTATRIVLAGTSGELEDSADFTFDGTTFNVGQGNFTVDVATGNISTQGTFGVQGQTTADSLAVSDLTAGRVVLAGTAGELEDSANLTFDGSLLTVTGNARVTGNLDVDGNITLGGNIRIGDQDVDTVEVQADFTSDLIPNGPNQFDLGTVSKGWRTLYTGQIEVDALEINDNYIRTQVSNADIEIRPNGTGTFIVDADTAMKIPVGDNTTRPVGEPGQIRFNSSTSLFEGYQGTAWLGLGGVRDTDQDTYIVPELTAGGDEDTLFFYTGGTLRAELDSTTLDLKGGDVLFSNRYATVNDLPNAFNNIGTFAYVTATDKAYYSKNGQWIELVGQKGNFEIEGTLDADGIKIGTGVITNTDLNGNINLTTNGAGLVYINGDRVAVFGDDISEFNNDANYITLTDLSATGDIQYNNNTGVFSVTTYKTADFESDFANQTTDDLSEGTTNLYFLNSRARAAISVSDNGGDGELTYDSATGVITYTGPSAAEVRAHFSAGGDLSYNSATGEFSVTTFKTADARQSIAVNDNGGDGSLTYNSTTGVITYTGPSAAEVRAHFSAGGDLSYDSNTGEFSVTTYKDADARAAISVTDAGGDGSLAYNSTTGVITYTGPSATEVRAHFSAGGDLAYNQTTGEFSVTTYKDADARGAISVTDAGGDGSMTYNNTTGVITYTGPSAAEVRAHFSASGDLSYNNANGVFSVTTYKSADFDTDFAGKSTDDLAEGATNQYFTQSRARQSVSASGDLTYNNTTGVFSVTTYKTADFNTDFAASSFDDLDDTDFTAKTNNQLIRWNGTDWVNFTIGIDFLSDVDISSVAPNVNEILAWDGSKFVPSATVSLSQVEGDSTFTDNLTVVGDIIGGALITDDIRIAGNRIETTASNSILELGTQGTGIINLLDNTLFNGTVTISDTLTANGNTVLGNANTDTVTFNADVASDIIPSTSTLDLGSSTDSWQAVYAGNLEISGNSLTAIDTNGNVELTPNGTGYIDSNTVTALKIPAGTTAERPATLAQGQIRYNTTTSRFEAYDGTNWTGLGGVIDVDQDTKIVAETAPGTDNDQLEFYAGGLHVLTVDANGITFDTPTTNTISTLNGSLILDPAPAGTQGTVIIQGDLTVQGTTTTVNSTVTTLDDPLITLGGDTAPSTNDGKDRGVDFQWHDGVSAKLGFFGYDASAAKFKFIPDAVNASEVISGAVGNVEFNDATLNDITANSLTLTDKLDVTEGGTGVDTFTLNGILYGNGADDIQVTDAAGTSDVSTSNQILTTTAGGVPVWTDTIDEGTY
jgi:hypothetical protein